ncbi:GTP cyclohydrolase FolE2 [Pseudobacteriovorax antillogorgiicola]|uniref:GTP cyclohydrolase I n=1 Tax=Pseudobacteriovorax antillogorgiicola TaxID=1513793 RepID=A0A1Y6C202_9BACT|nr:GTP cyclohydrolase FolE2 [Pseudobacteriovorax antillogorgiicola]TCS50215.1 GTP cyclohydrolase I [Pseudobacteriovorax antillogorgiicola]SMF32488.1 GTP cyclohydrolase I [Pseudobacteriovorax antillogorgiicola]
MLDSEKALATDKLSDVAADSSSPWSIGIDQSGMTKIAVPINLDLNELGHQTQFAEAAVSVNMINPQSKGIHMSRLYLRLTQRMESEPFSMNLVEQLLEDFLASHQDISDSAYLRLAFKLPIKRPALISTHSGWRLYPVVIESKKDGQGFHHQVSLELQYSSTCPCSASLSRQLIQDKFRQDFGGENTVSAGEMLAWLGKESSICGVPHSQRSTAKVSFSLDNIYGLDLVHLVRHLEDKLQTPVQTAVKREDEQEFARLNAANLMFVEDAVRNIYKAMQSVSYARRVTVETIHHESLHAHDARAMIQKSVH